MIPKEDFTDVTPVIYHAFSFTSGGGGDNEGMEVDEDVDNGMVKRLDMDDGYGPRDGKVIWT